MTRSRHVALLVVAIILLAALPIVSGALAEAGDAPDTLQKDDWLVFTEPSFGYQISYPPDWHVTLTSDNTSRASQYGEEVVLRSIGFFGPNSEMVFVDVRENRSGLSLQEWEDRYPLPIATETNDHEIVSYPSTLLDNDAIETLVNPQDTTYGLPWHRSTQMMSGDLVFNIEYAGLSGNSSVYDAMLASFQIVPASRSRTAPATLQYSMPPVEYGVQVATCCGITDPEYNPFDCLNGNCTWWARFARRGNNEANLYNCTGNANTWDECAAQHYPHLLSDTPQQSSVVVWMYSGDNHVQFIEIMDNATQYYVSDMSWNSTCPQKYSNQTQSSRYKYIRHPDTGGFTCTDVLPVGEGSSRPQLFVDAYNRMGGRAKLGCTRGGAYWWSDSGSGLAIVRQDFTGNDGSNQVMITHNESDDNPAGSVPAHVTWGALYTRWIQLGSIGTTAYGIPTSDEYFNGNNQPQSSFTSGYITWDGDSFEFYNWPGAITGQWRIKYFTGRTDNFNREPTWVANLNTTGINFNWGEEAPGNGHWGVWRDNFSMAAAKPTLFDAGRYRFHVKADDGVKLWVDSTLLINEWHSSSGNDYYAEINLTQGNHLLVLAYYEDSGAALVNLDWVKINPPATPTLNAINNSDGDGAYTVSWSSVSGATSYTLQEQFNSGSFGDIYTGSNTSQNRSGRSAGQWCYRLRANNSAGSSGWSGTKCATVSDLKPDLMPFAPSGYQYPVVPSGITGTTVEGLLTAGDETYFDWHFTNAGGATAAADFHVELWVDGTRHVRYPWSSVTVGAVEGFDDWMEYINSPGTHTVKLVIDPDNTVAESNEGNNIWERQFVWNPPDDSGATVFLSPAGAKTVGGLAVTGADILRYERGANRWTMVYDGSVRGTPKNLSAFSLLADDSLLLVFAANQAIAGLGTATPYDIVRFIPNNPDAYPLGTGTYEWFFRGKSFGLTTTGEKIDAVDWVGSWLMLSTSGAAKVTLPTGAVLKAADEDVFVYELNNARWRDTLLIDGSLIPGMAVEDLSGLWDDQTNGDFYISITGSFTINGVKGNGKSIIKLTPNGGPTVFTPSLVEWLAPGATFPINLDEIDMGGR